MGLSKVEQRKLIKEKLAKEQPPAQGIKRLIKGKVKVLSKKQNAKYNEKKHKRAVVFYGLNNNKL